MELKGGPFLVDNISREFVGVYANYVGGLGEATTKVDGFILKELGELSNDILLKLGTISPKRR
jgi:hypothetical protein